MIKSKVLAQGWESYRTEVVPVTAGPNQVHETEMAFMAGAKIMFDAFLKLSELSEDDGFLVAQAMSEELDAALISVAYGPTPRTVN